MLKQYCTLRKRGFLALLSLPVLFLLFQLCMTAGVSLACRQGAPAGFRVLVTGGLLALVFSGGFLFLNSALRFSCQLDLLLSLGRSRHQARALLFRYAGLLWALAAVLTLALSLLEEWLMPGLFGRIAGPSLQLERNLPPLWALPLILLACTLGGIICSMLVRRWGQRAGAALYLAFMAWLLLFNYTDSFFAKTLPLQVVLLALFLVVGGLWSLREINRTAVKF